MAKKQDTPEMAERKARAAVRIVTSEKKIKRFQKHYAEVGLSNKVIAEMAMMDPIDMTARLTPDPDEEMP